MAVVCIVETVGPTTPSSTIVTPANGVEFVRFANKEHNLEAWPVTLDGVFCTIELRQNNLVWGGLGRQVPGSTRRC